MNCLDKIKSGKCKAGCCGPVPFDRHFYQITSAKHFRKVVREDLVQDSRGNDLIIPFTEDLTCTYLDKDLQCSIYNFRPEVCRLFGDNEHKFLKCPHK